MVLGAAALAAVWLWLAAYGGGDGGSGTISMRRVGGGGGYRHQHGHHQHGTGSRSPVTLDVRDMPVVELQTDSEPAGRRQTNCSYWDCFDVYRCGHGRVADRMSVYVYPLKRYVDATNGGLDVAPLSREFHRVLRAIRQSVYYTADPLEACVFVPSIDVLNENRVDGELVSTALAGLE